MPILGLINHLTSYSANHSLFSFKQFASQTMPARDWACSCSTRSSFLWPSISQLLDRKKTGFNKTLHYSVSSLGTMSKLACVSTSSWVTSLTLGSIILGALRFHLYQRQQGSYFFSVMVMSTLSVIVSFYVSVPPVLTWNIHILVVGFPGQYPLLWYSLQDSFFCLQDFERGITTGLANV